MMSFIHDLLFFWNKMIESETHSIPTCILLWELLQLILFEILPHFGHGHMHFIYRCKSVGGPLAAGFGSGPLLMPISESMPK